MRRVLHDQVHVAVDAGAGVPAAVEMCAALDADLVVGAELEVRVDLHEESRVPVGALAGEVAVDVDYGVAVDAVELEQDLAAALLLGRRRRSCGTRRRRPGSSRWSRRAATSARRSVAMSASCGRSTSAQLEADEPPSSMNAVTFGRNSQPSLKIVRVIGNSIGSSCSSRD